jgi:hypothetical protein
MDQNYLLNGSDPFFPLVLTRLSFSFFRGVRFVAYHPHVLLTLADTSATLSLTVRDLPVSAL